MNILVILLIVLLLFGGVGFYGHANSWGPGLYGGGGGGLIVLIIILVLLFR